MKKNTLIGIAAMFYYCAHAQVGLIGKTHQPVDSTTNTARKPTSDSSIVTKEYQYADPNKKPYTWGIGAKFQPSALSVKWYSKSGDAMEVLVSRFNHGSRGTVLLEISPGLSTNGHFRLLIGPGLHLSVIERAYFFTQKAKNPVFGCDGIGGFEWTFPKAHLALQADFQPSFDFNGNNDSYLDWGGLTLRYVW